MSEHPRAARLCKADIIRLFGLLNDELAAEDCQGELYVGGGAATGLNLPETWLNDAVKGFLSPRAEFDDYLELDHLRVFVANPSYLLAMKCAAMRLGEEFHDLEDVRYLLRYLDIGSPEEALAVVTRYFDEERLPAMTRPALEELLGT